jgi:hypothetical protein
MTCATTWSETLRSMDAVGALTTWLDMKCAKFGSAFR